MKIRQFDVAPNIPERLARLKDLAMNLWFCWNWEAVRLFIRLDAKLWEECYQNPVLMLGRLPQSLLDRLSQDPTFVADLDRVYEDFSNYLSRQGWFQRAHADKQGFLTAYFSCEYGIDEGLPVYSGGLGTLSGDHLKSASDLGLPLVGVGLLYQKGYFKQRLNLDGWQQEDYPDNDWYNMPVSIERAQDGCPVTVTVDLAGDTVTAQVWRVQVGRIPLYLLDTNLPENPPHHRGITGELYGGDRDMRIRQEMVLAVGGVRALEALGLKPTVYHINEGHSAFITIERIRKLVKEEGLSCTEAAELVRPSTVFTTHTPVPAGNEIFDIALVKKYLSPIVAQIGMSWEKFVELGQDGSGSPPTTFSMPALALRLSAFSNGVSALHGEVSRKMWNGLWPGLLPDEVPITSVTNGIHTRSWISHDLGDLLDKYIGPRFRENPEDQATWQKVDSVPDAEIWQVHQIRRERLVHFARKRLRADLDRQGAGSAIVKMTAQVLDPGILTLGFARRFAAYKRAGLLLADGARLSALLNNPKFPVQIVFSGKAHPQDSPGKELIKKIIHFARQPEVRNRIAFIEDYDINVARYLVQGVDVWVNTPVRPLEASGTSGMKAVANGVPNLSVLDGWWVEGYSPAVGWTLGARTDYDSDSERDHVDSEALYNILEREIVPLFYQRDSRGVPVAWVKMMKECLKSLADTFNTHRMVREYTELAYLPAHASMTLLAADGAARARELARWRTRVASLWPRLCIEAESIPGQSSVLVGDKFLVRAHARLGTLTSNDVRVEVVYGATDAKGGFVKPSRVVMAVVQESAGLATYEANIVCTQSGRSGFAVRALPYHKDMMTAVTPLLLTCEE